MKPIENEIPAQIVSIEPMSWLKNAHHVTVQITGGDLERHTVSFQIIRRHMKLDVGQHVTVRLWFKPVAKNGLTYHWLKGEVLTDLEQAINQFHNSTP
jgi:hypothetical protein